MDNAHKMERDQSLGTMSRSMLLVMMLTMVSKVTGFLREMVLASRYGAAGITDAFKTAEALPCFFLSMIVTAISATLIPSYSVQLEQGREKADRFINNIYTVGIFFSVVVLIITSLVLEPLANVMMMELENDDTRRLAIDLARTMMPMGIFVFLARITSAYLQANFNFAVPALSQLFLNIVIIASILLSRGVNIFYVAIGTVVGWALQFVVQLPSVRRTKLTYRPVFNLKDSGLREMLFLMVPVLVASAFDQVYLTFDKMVAFRGAEGDASMLDYANRISTMVSSVLLTTVATVLYPSLVRHVSNREKFRENLTFGINVNLLIALPAMAMFVLLSIPITRLVYERNAFTSSTTLLTAPLLACYACGILGVGMRELCNRSFYALKNTVIPTVVGIGVVILNIALNFALYPIFGLPGIPVATAISTTLSGVILLLLLHVRNHAVDGPRMLRCVWKTAAATAVMSAVLRMLYVILHLGTQTGLTLLIGMAITGIACLIVYIVVLYMLRSEELKLALDAVQTRLRYGKKKEK